MSANSSRPTSKEALRMLVWACAAAAPPNRPATNASARKERFIEISVERIGSGGLARREQAEMAGADLQRLAGGGQAGGQLAAMPFQVDRDRAVLGHRLDPHQRADDIDAADLDREGVA